MKHSFIAFIFLSLFVISTYGQSGVIDQLYEKYKDDERFSQVMVSSKMFSMFANFDMEDPDNQELVDAISKLQGMKVLIGEDIEEAASLQSQFIGIAQSGMEELMSVRDGETNLNIYVNESAGTVKELVMVVLEDRQVILLNLVGEIDLKQLSRLSQKMNIGGFEHLENIEEK